MTADRQIMRRKKKTLIIKCVAGGLVCLLLFRVDLIGLLTLKFLRGGARSPMGLMRGVPCLGDNCHVGGKKDSSLLRRMMNKQQEEQLMEEPGCKLPRLKNTVSVNLDRDVQCVRSLPSRASCRVAEELFSGQGITKPCKGRKPREFCSIKLANGQLDVDCKLSKCNRELHMGVFDMKTGRYVWSPYKDATALEAAINELISTDNSGYCMILCGERGSKLPENDADYAESGFKSRHPQILNLPPILEKQEPKQSRLDFNVIFIDSTSRHHFFRTLPKSLAVLESISEGVGYSYGAKPLVLDYHLVQGVRSRTYETLQTFFSGYVNPYERTFGIQAMPNEAMKIETLFKPVQELGYKTLWLEDLCPLWEWGISKDLLAYDKNIKIPALLDRLKEAVNKAGIDSIGNTLASCAMLKANGVPDPFHGPDEICFNEKYQLDYQLDYLKLYQQSMLSKNQSFFTFYETNIGHEERGHRIKQLDSKLAEYLTFVKTMTNTITILMSDHGNSYSDFFQRSREGRVELYHPFIFIIIPEKVQHLISPSKIHSLLLNQYKLVSVLDLHYMISDLIESLYFKAGKNLEESTFRKAVFDFNQQFHITKQGLMGNISESRSCSVMPRIMPNLCICRDYEVKTSKFSSYYILALYAVGELNNEIQSQRRTSTKGDNSVGGFGSCVRLRPAEEPVKNIQETQINKNTKSITMDVHTSSPVQHQAEIFFIALEIPQEDQGKLKLLNYDRISIYGKYAPCADLGVTLSLCVCDLDLHKVKNPFSVIYNYTYDNTHLKLTQNEWESVKNLKLRNMVKNTLNKNLEIKIQELDIQGVKCVAIVMQSNDAGVIVEAINSCSVIVTLSIQLRSNDITIATGQHIQTDLFPSDVTMVTAGVAEDGAKWKWEMDIDYSLKTA